MDHEDVEQRLRNIGRQPINARTRREHLERIAAVPTTDDNRPRGFVWAGIAAAAVTGFLVGSTGLAMADALPDRAQTVAHDVLGAVQVDVPQGKQGKRGPCVSEAAKIRDKDAKKAAKDACPKGDESGTAGDDESDDANDQSDAASSVENGAPQGQGQGKHAGDPCHGRPPWAGPMSKEDRAAAKAANSRDACPDDEGDASDSAEAADTEDTQTAEAIANAVATTTRTTTTTTPASDSDSTTP